MHGRYGNSIEFFLPYASFVSYFYKYKFMSPRLPEDRDISEQVDDIQAELEMDAFDRNVENLAYTETEAERGPIRTEIRRDTDEALRKLRNL